MDITEEIREEEAMSGKLKIKENKKGGDTIDTEKSEKSKSKKISEPSLKDMKITLPSSKSDDHSLSSMSKFSHGIDKIPRRKKKIIPGPLVKAPKVTQGQDDMEKDDKVSSSIEGSKQTTVCVTPHLLFNTPPTFNNKRDYIGNTHDKTLESSTKDTNIKKK